MEYEKPTLFSLDDGDDSQISPQGVIVVAGVLAAVLLVVGAYTVAGVAVTALVDAAVSVNIGGSVSVVTFE